MILRRNKIFLNCSMAFSFFTCKDRVIAIPREFIEATILGADLSQQFLFYCSVSGNDMR